MEPLRVVGPKDAVSWTESNDEANPRHTESLSSFNGLSQPNLCLRTVEGCQDSNVA
jgi:hypothetical protein